MPRRPETYLYDIRLAIGRLRRFTADKTLDDYLHDELLRAAVERQFEIIGEALNQLGRVAPEQLQRIREHARIIAFRNILIHGYAVIDDRVVWDIVQSKLTALEEDISALLPPG